jgi:polysaccharide pyruvyl transferase CsaB
MRETGNDRPNSVTLLGYYGFNNLGDDLLLLAAITALQSLTPVPTVQVLSQQPSLTRQAYVGADRVLHRMRPWAVWQALRASHWLILGGGGLFQDATSVNNCVYYAGMVLMARLLGNRVVWWGQGIGPLNHPLSVWLTRLALGLTSVVSVRDEASETWVRRHCPTKTVYRLPDPAWLLSLQSGPVRRWGVGVSLREWPTLTQAGVEQLAVCLHQSVPDEEPIVLLPFQPEQDAPVLTRLQQALPATRKVQWGNCTITHVQATLASLSGLVAMRFHALLLGACQHTPLMAIAYDPKVAQLAYQLKLSAIQPHALGQLTTLTLAHPDNAAVDLAKQQAHQAVALLHNALLG